MSGKSNFENIHATCVAIDGKAVLLTGHSGAGKSDLALRLLDRGAALVSDDYTIVTRTESSLVAGAPETIKGKLEVRGVGIISHGTMQNVVVVCIIDLNQAAERFPSNTGRRTIAGVALPLFGLNAFEASSPLKVELIVRELCKS